ncbi:MAG: hypothetical protein ACYC0T_15395 [Ramlibacter sp.]
MKPAASGSTSRVRPVHPGQPLRTLAQDGVASLDDLKAATMRCRECPIGEFATQSVIGEGPRKAPLMLVGEQPGDQEDLRRATLSSAPLGGSWQGRWSRSGSPATRCSSPTR